MRPSLILGRRLPIHNGRQKILEENIDTLCTAVTQIFEITIDDTYHKGATNIGQRGFGYLTIKEILENLPHLYGKPSLPKLEKALLKLHEPMYYTIPVEVMLRGMEEIKMSLPANPNKERKLMGVLMISYALTKMVNIGLYGKSIER